MKKSINIFVVLVIMAIGIIPLYSQKLPTLKAQLKQLELGIRYLKLGNTFREGRFWEMSESNIEKGLDIVKKYNSRYWIATAYEYYAYLYRDMGYKEKARIYLVKARDIFDAIITQDKGSQDAIRYVLENLDNEADNAEYESLLSENEDLKFKNSSLSIKIEDLEVQIHELNSKIDKLMAKLESNKKEAIVGLPKENGESDEYKTYGGESDSKSGSPSGSNPFGSSKGKGGKSGGTNTSGSVVLMSAIGFGTTFGLGTTSFPPVTLTLNFRVPGNMEMGVFGAYSTESYMGGSLTYQLLGLRVMYILFKGNNWDASVSAVLAYNILSAQGYTYNPSVSAYLYGGLIDFRYFLTSNIGLFLEGGYGLTYVSGGVAIKI